MKKDMINGLSLLFAQCTLAGQNPPSPLKLIQSQPFPNKPPKRRNSPLKEYMGSKLSLKGKGWFHQSPPKSKAFLHRKLLCYLSSKLLYPPTPSSLIVLRV